MKKDQNPYLQDVVFLNKETFLHASSMTCTGPAQTYSQEYLTDPANRGMLVLGTLVNGEGREKDFTTLTTTRTGKEMVLDQCKDSRILSYRFLTNPTNDNVLKHIIEAYELTPLQDFTPPFRAGTEHMKRYRFGTLSAGILSSEHTDKLIAEFNVGGEFYIMRQPDQQGKDEKKTYFSTDMRKFSKQDEGRAAVMALAQTEHQGSLTFFPVTGTMNKYWGVIDKLLTRDQVANLLKKANKIQAGDRRGQLKTFVSLAMQKEITYLEGAGGSDHYAKQNHTQRRMNTAAIAITGWPQQAEPEQVQATFRYWGVELDLTTVTIGWYFGTDYA
jgi:hypothetical protein